MPELMAIFKTIDTIMIGCDIDFIELNSQTIDESFFDSYQNVRVINSFLFNYSKIQDKIGSKLFKKVLYVQKEIDSEEMSMKDILNILEKLRILENTFAWDKLREIRNNLAHEYPYCIEERIENIALTMEGYKMLKNIYFNLKRFCDFSSLQNSIEN